MEKLQRGGKKLNTLKSHQAVLTVDLIAAFSDGARMVEEKKAKRPKQRAKEYKDLEKLPIALLEK